ncbi:MAG: GyrI-like domain-containing protein [Chloroflexi bacterium]|nr:GyrI-like domain-containing protein [Chloroflexota bacterium]
MFKIGVFSRLVQVPVATLRYYDYVGLLKPDRVDAQTGYRYYSADQLPRLHRILALRGLGFSLEEIGQALESQVPSEQMRGMLRLRQAQLNQELAEAQQRLREVEMRLQQIEHEGEISTYDVLLKAVEPQIVALVRATVPSHAMIGALFDELIGILNQGMTAALQVEPGRSMALWFDSEYRPHHVDGAAAVLLDERIPNRGSMEVVELPGGTMASAVHHGSYETLYRAHEAVLQWIEANGYHVAGPDREVYLYNAAPVRRDDPSFITEVQYPVARVDPSSDAEDAPRARTLTGVMESDEIVDIPNNRVKFFGTTGKMLLPSPQTIADVLRTIPEGRLVTTEQLSQAMAERFAVEAVCPVTTYKSLRALGADPSSAAPVWRVVKQNGDLPVLLTGGPDGQAAFLAEEGIEIESSGKTPKVKGFRNRLAHIDQHS